MHYIRSASWKALITAKARHKSHASTTTFALTFIVKLFFSFAIVPAYANENILLILSSNAAYYQQTANSIINNLTSKHPELTLSTSTVVEIDNKTIGSNQLLISIGTTATEKIIQNFPGNPSLSLFITEPAWLELTKNITPNTSEHAVIFVDQPYPRIAALAAILMPNIKIVSTIFGPISEKNYAIFEDSINDNERKLIFSTLSESDNPLAKITPLIEASDLFIALPDRGIFNRNIAKWALYLSYQHKIPVLGFSSSYTKAGALASIFSSPMDIANEGVDWIHRYIQNPDTALWQAYHPQQFSIDVNPYVAQILNINIPSNQKIHDALVQYINNQDSP